MRAVTQWWLNLMSKTAESAWSTPEASGGKRKFVLRHLHFVPMRENRGGQWAALQGTCAGIDTWDMIGRDKTEK